MQLSLVAAILSLFIVFSCDNGKKNHYQNQETKSDSLLKDSLEKAQKEPEIQYDRKYNDAARLIAGLEPIEGSTTAAFDTLPAVIKHRKVFNALFEKKEKEQLAPLRKLVLEEMKEAHLSNRNVYYPFAGADVVTIHTIYPNAKNYVMFGLEIEGRIPDFSKIPAKNMERNLNNLNQSISHLMSLSFFMTKHMAGDFIRTDFYGTTPILMAFVVRMGNELLDVQHVKLNKQGEIETYNPQNEKIKQTPWDDIVTGIQLKFRKNKKAPVQTLTYFCINIANDNLEKNNEFLLFLDKYKPTNTYVKAASYLMHGANYSMIREKLLEITQVLLQDDSGVPYRFFLNDSWKVTLYGKYNGPIPLFKAHFQKDYFNDYQAKKDSIRDLDFGIGYVYTKGRSNLMKAEKLKEVKFAQNTIKKEKRADKNKLEKNTVEKQNVNED